MKIKPAKFKNGQELVIVPFRKFCAKELGFNLHHERRCGPAFSKPRQALWFSGLSWGTTCYTRGRGVVFNDWMLGETKPLKQRERGPRDKEELTFTATGKCKRNRDKALLTE
ncbi:hypothetical protein MTP99_014301 [Tenebrio molitor]|nr:hypothetical protein MTP99_014301 [Tenebrio molitor]